MAITSINVTYRKDNDDYVAIINGDPTRWSCGSTRETAVFDVLRAHGLDFELALNTPGVDIVPMPGTEMLPRVLAWIEMREKDDITVLEASKAVHAEEVLRLETLFGLHSASMNQAVRIEPRWKDILASRSKWFNTPVPLWFAPDRIILQVEKGTSKGAQAWFVRAEPGRP